MGDFESKHPTHIHNYKTHTYNMGLLDSVKPGVVTGKECIKVLEYAREHQFAIPAFNVPPLRLSSPPSRVLAMPRLPSSSRSPRVVPPSSAVKA